MLHFDVGICVHTQKEIDEIFELFINTYPEARAVKKSNYCFIDLPMIRISFLLSGQAIGYRFDKIYYSDDANIEEKNEVLLPMTLAARASSMRPISSLYKELNLMEEEKECIE